MVHGFIFFCFHPETWGRFSPILTFAYFSDGLVQPATRFKCHVLDVIPTNRLFFDHQNYCIFFPFVICLLGGSRKKPSLSTVAGKAIRTTYRYIYMAYAELYIRTQLHNYIYTVLFMYIYMTLLRFFLHPSTKIQFMEALLSFCSQFQAWDGFLDGEVFHQITQHSPPCFLLVRKLPKIESTFQ